MGTSGTKWEEVESPLLRGVRRTASGDLLLIKEKEQMFLGQYQHSLDEKGRLTIPARFRELLEEGAYVTQGFDRNLMVMTNSYFKLVYERLSEMNIADSAARLLRRLILSNAYAVEADKSGRILLPQNLRAYLGLNGEAVIVGQGEYFEVWSPSVWYEQVTKMQDAEANAQRFATLDLTPSESGTQ
jgi:transcriptional regulator MraZ